MNLLTGTLGRLLYGIPFGVFGILHFMNANMMAGMVPSWLPGSVFWVYLTGVAFLAASVSIVIEKKTRLALILLGTMFLVFVLTVHLPGVIGGEMQPNLPNMFKDLAFAGAAWFIAGNYENGESGGGEFEE